MILNRASLGTIEMNLGNNMVFAMSDGSPLSSNINFNQLERAQGKGKCKSSNSFNNTTDPK